MKADQYLSRLSEVTEEQCKVLVESVNSIPNTYHVYTYNSANQPTYATDSAKESFLSALKDEGVLKRNPWDNTDERFTSRKPICILGISQCDHIKLSNGKNRICECKEWNQAEANVFSPLTTLIFVEQ